MPCIFCQLVYQGCYGVIVVTELRSNLLRGKCSVVESNYKMRFIFICISGDLYLIIKNENRDAVKYRCFIMHYSNMIFYVKLNKKNK
ncbi:hypothetical protein AYY17_09505 [Morganella psychrotolerans]|uniref:Uncharacterized protein n=1 Tax=Morganella psychrotolerans TaxID=368603 RepID=A0A1B8H418_9GAMM|nr:hypothetical protein AYY17_09505 [Morganella psychrotolerans]